MITSKTKARHPGRPTESTDLRKVILEQAELAFADAGFDGAKLRGIAARAGVNQALVRYYFGSKQDLFDELVRIRGAELARKRILLLTQLESRSVESIIHAYLRPQWEMKQSGGNAAAFLRMQARIHASPDPHHLQLRREIYDHPLKQYIDALHELLPDHPRALIAMRMSFLVGSYMFMLNDLGRLGDVIGDASEGWSEADRLNELVRFLASGVTAPLG